MKVCSNCRSPLEGKSSKYCKRCAPHVKRMRDSARFRTKKWEPVSKFCRGCGRILPISSFPVRKKRSKGGAVFYRSRCRSCKAMQTKRRNARKRKLPRTLTQLEWWDTLERFGYACVYCGKVWEVQEHLVPVAKDGGYTRTNIVPACWECNSYKSDMWLGTFTSRAFEILHTLGIH